MISRKSASRQVMMVARGLKWIFSTLFLIPVQGNFRLEVIRGQIVRIGGSSCRREHLQCWRFFSPQGFRAAVGHTTSGRIDAFVNTLVRLVVHKRARFTSSGIDSGHSDRRPTMWSREPAFEPTAEQSPPRLPPVPGRELRRPARFVGVGNVCAFLFKSRSLKKFCHSRIKNAAFQSSSEACPLGRVSFALGANLISNSKMV